MRPALFQKDLERVADAFNESQKGREFMPVEIAVADDDSHAMYACCFAVCS